MRAALTCLFVSSLLSTCSGLQERLCPKPVLPSDVQLTPAGVDVNLTCPEDTWEGNANFMWKLGNRTLGTKPPNRLVAGAMLMLKSVRHRDSGNYTCYWNGLRICSIHLMVREILEVPQMSCTRKFPVGVIRCQYNPLHRPSPTTRAVLLVRKGFNTEPKTKPCTYYNSSQRYICLLKLGEGDHASHMVFMCITSMADSQFSTPQMISGYSVIQPDPPVNVMVSPVEGAPRKLIVTWQYPPTWNPSFYKLQFQVKYRAEHSPLVNTALIQLKSSCLIVDALTGRRHVVQVRAQEEFGHGSWSHWSPEAIGVPWTDAGLHEEELQSTVLPPDYSTEDISSYSTEDYNIGDPLNGQPAISRRPTDPAMDQSHLHISQYTFFIAGASLAFGAILFVGIMIRYKKKWLKDSSKGGKLHFVFPFCPQRKMTSEELQPSPNTIPLVSPPSSPISDVPADVSEDPASPDSYDVTNLNYFFFQR
ncbi:hypothetical protein NDU88_001111 [Pleurodeles waltl]|uniref:Interleukin-6 receptor subunit alpha n=1 Tax=Pleurodeles waltl TaxID=8319 RepID=A0AAV7KXK5_PLEWA|nr:hypothetical protein NDU88_001111 [Pleurodeles waltl]